MKAHYCRIALLCAFAFLNILTPIALAKSLPWYYPRVRAVASGRHFTGRHLYWAAALIAFLFNVMYTGTSLFYYFHSNRPAITSCIVYLPKHKCTIPSDTSLYKDEVLTLVAKVTIIPIAVFAELFVSILTARNHFGRRYGSRCRLWQHCLLQAVHVIALWNILILLQIITMCAIPLCILLLTHPQVTFLCLSAMVMTLVGMTLIVAYLMYQCQSPRKRRVCCSVRHCGSIFVHITMIISAVGLIVTLLTLYEMILVVQVQVETGITRFVLSLLPSLPLSALGWYVRRRSQRAVTNECSETSQSSEEQQSTNQSCSDMHSEDENPLPLKLMSASTFLTPFSLKYTVLIQDLNRQCSCYA